MICKHGRLDEEGEKTVSDRINDKTSKVSQNIVIRDCGHQQNFHFALRMIRKVAYDCL